MTLSTKTEVAQTLNITERTIESWVANRIIPFHKFGNGSVRFNIEEILNATREEVK